MTLAALLLLCATARADSEFMHGTGGTLRPLHGAESGVRLVRESVRAEVFASRCEATATFELRNDGAARELVLAFPESEDYSAYSAFRTLDMTLDGRAFKARRVVAPANREQERPSSWLARVSLGRGQSRSVRVSYQSEYEGLLHAGDFAYKFNGGGWSGDVEESSLRVTFRAPGTHLCQGFVSSSSSQEPLAVDLRRLGHSLFFERRQWQPRGEFSLVFEPAFASGWLSYEGIRPRQHSVTVPGSPIGVRSAVLWLPTALARGGTTFVSLDEMDRRLTGRSFEVVRGGALSWKDGSKTATLRAGGHTLRFQAGRRAMRADGRLVSLPSAPFVEEGAGHDMGAYSFFYVPLAPVLRVLGGTANVNAPAHRFFFRGPLFRKPAED